MYLRFVRESAASTIVRIMDSTPDPDVEIGIIGIFLSHSFGSVELQVWVTWDECMPGSSVKLGGSKSIPETRRINF
jgi:hypothetical protein